MNTARNYTLVGAMLALLSACGNDGGAGADAISILAQTASQVALPSGQDGVGRQAAPAKSPEEAAAEAMRVNSSPLIRTGFESLGQTQIMAMTGQNGSMRTYMTPAEEALILRGGLLIGTRGLGNDLSVAEARTEPLIRAGRNGSGDRIMRYFAGDGLERPLQFTCSVGPGPRPSVTVEDCQGHGISFQNSYMVQDGLITVSRQWIGPALGYVTVQTLRP